MSNSEGDQFVSESNFEELVALAQCLDCVWTENYHPCDCKYRKTPEGKARCEQLRAEQEKRNSKDRCKRNEQGQPNTDQPRKRSEQNDECENEESSQDQTSSQARASDNAARNAQGGSNDTDTGRKSEGERLETGANNLKEGEPNDDAKQPEELESGRGSKDETNSDSLTRQEKEAALNSDRNSEVEDEAASSKNSGNSDSSPATTENQDAPGSSRNSETKDDSSLNQDAPNSSRNSENQASPVSTRNSDGPTPTSDNQDSPKSSRNSENENSPGSKRNSEGAATTLEDQNSPKSSRNSENEAGSSSNRNSEGQTPTSEEQDSPKSSRNSENEANPGSTRNSDGPTPTSDDQNSPKSSRNSENEAGPSSTRNSDGPSPISDEQNRPQSARNSENEPSPGSTRNSDGATPNSDDQNSPKSSRNSENEAGPSSTRNSDGPSPTSDEQNRPQSARNSENEPNPGSTRNSDGATPTLEDQNSPKSSRNSENEAGPTSTRNSDGATPTSEDQNSPKSSRNSENETGPTSTRNSDGPTPTSDDQNSPNKSSRNSENEASPGSTRNSDGPTPTLDDQNSPKSARNSDNQEPIPGSKPQSPRSSKEAAPTSRSGSKTGSKASSPRTSVKNSSGGSKPPSTPSSRKATQTDSKIAIRTRSSKLSAVKKHSHFVEDTNKSDAHFYALNPTSELQQGLDKMITRMSHVKGNAPGTSSKQQFHSTRSSRASSKANVTRESLRGSKKSLASASFSSKHQMPKTKSQQIKSGNNSKKGSASSKAPSIKDIHDLDSKPHSETDVHHQIFHEPRHSNPDDGDEPLIVAEPQQNPEQSSNRESLPEPEPLQPPQSPSPPLPLLENESPLNPRKTPEGIPDRPFVTESIYNDLVDLGRFSSMQWDRNYHPCYEENPEAFGIKPIRNCAELNQRFDSDDPPPPFPSQNQENDPTESQNYDAATTDPVVLSEVKEPRRATEDTVVENAIADSGIMQEPIQAVESEEPQQMADTDEPVTNEPPVETIHKPVDAAVLENPDSSEEVGAAPPGDGPRQVTEEERGRGRVVRISDSVYLELVERGKIREHIDRNNYVETIVTCPPPSPTAPIDRPQTVFDFGEPVMFVASESQKYDPYSLVDQHRTSAVLQEYLMIGYKPEIWNNKTIGVFENLTLVIFDEVDNIDDSAVQEPDLVHQNLEKELYWKYINSSGVFPLMTVTNTTMVQVSEFTTAPHDNISLHAVYKAKDYSFEPVLPLDATFELPGNTRVLRKSKSIIEFQSFSLWRWKLSDKVATWEEILAKTDADIPAPSLPSTSTPTNLMERIDNPCTKDLCDSRRLQLCVTKQFLGATETVELLTLTNDHFVVMTDHDLWISESTNVSAIENMAKKMTERPTLSYKKASPCSKLKDNINCFDHSATPKTSHKLFYNPVCYLYQFPHNDDFLIFVVDGTNDTTAANGDYPRGHGFTIVYAADPYTEWKVLFANVNYYNKLKSKKRFHVKDIVGIFFNHHLRHFDLTLKLEEIGPANPIATFTRIALPHLLDSVDGYGHIVEEDVDILNPGNQILKELSIMDSNGFVNFDFPPSFQMTSVVLNVDTNDVFFLGNQLWIAEQGGPFVYVSLNGFQGAKDNDWICTKQAASAPPPPPPATPPPSDIIRECSFNHPDRTFICMNGNRKLMFAGRIGTLYSPIIIEVDKIPELIQAQRVHGWPKQYFCDLVQKNSVFVSAFSGNILMWYINEPGTLAAAQIPAISGVDPKCTPDSQEPIVCEVLQYWKNEGCTAQASPDEKAEFRLLSIEPTDLTQRTKSSDGPLVPYFVDANAVTMFEGIVPDKPAGMPIPLPGSATQLDHPIYFSEANIGQNIFCHNYDLHKEDGNNVFLQNNCQIFVRHIKTVQDYLDGFRSCLYGTVSKNPPLLPIPADIVVLQFAWSNKAFIKIDDIYNVPPFSFSVEHIGQTLFLPGNFSILLSGFPKKSSLGSGPDYSIMEGYTTLYSQFERRLVYNAFYAYLMDLSTQRFRDIHMALQEETYKAEEKRLVDIDREGKELEAKRIAERDEIRRIWSLSPWSKDGTGNTIKIFEEDYPRPYESRKSVEDRLLKVESSERHTKLEHLTPQPIVPITPAPAGDLASNMYVPYLDRTVWHFKESECNYILSLSDNKVLKSHGGRFSLDLHDSMSFEVKLRSTTALGRIMLYRPMLAITNSNPNILLVEKNNSLSRTFQAVNIFLTPTGLRTGVAVLTVRCIVNSLQCKESTSITFIVQVHRDFGRRLHVTYPIATCKPNPEKGRYPRPWAVEHTGCIKSEEILNENVEEVVRYHIGRRHVAYVTLPPNYRPPSFRGADIPLTKNVYNADPSKPAYKAWYKISQDSIQLTQCKNKKSKSECDCKPNDRLSDDEYYSECKEKVYFTRRTGPGKPIHISLEYDRIMKEEDQFVEFFTPKLNWSITIKEINGRTEWRISESDSAYILKINELEELNGGKRHYDMEDVNITLLGTGLFHFKATLGRVESFDEVSGHFILYADPNELNDIHMFIILLVTLTLCFTLVFLGFLAVRQRLSSQLPLQPKSHMKKLKGKLTINLHADYIYAVVQMSLPVSTFCISVL
ncbi:unnamed protein product [Orchesella dallaii]|uniref:Cation channel sperm-associated protein subunit beta C-terminal domain-containing protein n=1 Tax=Orchesella dallaii TaxID=48710 RepID=A0ABP1R3T4_9HEXA